MSSRLLRALTLTLLCLSALLLPTATDAARRGPHVCGREAAIALGSELDGVATRHRRSGKQLREHLQRDRSLCVDSSKRLYYLDRPAPPRRGVAEARIAAAPFPLANTFKLHSKPGAAKTIFLDFDGQTLTGTAWNASTGEALLAVPPLNTPATDDPGTFSNDERSLIQGIWQRVAEDFAPFDVNVTTEYPGEAALSRSDLSDPQYGVRVLFAGYSQAQVDALFGPAGGIAYVGSFDDTLDFFKPAFVFSEYLGPYDEKALAEAASHEAGHTLGLDHDGRIFPADEYYEGHGAEPMAWAPIMGVGYYSSIVQWSQGEYPSANNPQDDTAIIAGMVGWRADDHANTSTGATPLSAFGMTASGIIGSPADTDVFTFTTNGQPLSLRVLPAAGSPNLDILAELFDAGGALVAAANPLLELGATVDVPLVAGSYFLRVSGVGFGTTATGFTDYGSLGQYRVERVLPADVGGRNLRISAASAVLSWDAGTGQAGYYVLRDTIGVSGQVAFGPLAAGASGYTDATTVPGLLYCYQVLPFDGQGILARSDAECVLTGVATGVAPASLGLTLNQSTTATLTWAHPAGGVDTYLVGVIPLNGGGAPSTIALPGSATSMAHDTQGSPVCYLVAGLRTTGFGITDLLCGVPNAGTLASVAGYAELSGAAGLATLLGGQLPRAEAIAQVAAGLMRHSPQAQ